jgi:hypothetical protein
MRNMWRVNIRKLFPLPIKEGWQCRSHEYDMKTEPAKVACVWKYKQIEGL